MSTFCQHRARVFAGLWLATLLVSTLVLRAADSTNLTVHATDDPHPSGEGPTRLGQSTRVVLNTNAPVVTAAETNALGPAQKSFTWKVAWEGWNGLQIEAVQRTPLTDPMESLGLQPKGTGPLSYLHLEQVKLSGKFGARLEVDGAAFATTGDLTGFDPGIQLRRLRVFAGGDCILVLPLSYYIELGYGAGKFSLNQSTLTFPGGKYLGTLQVGQFQAPMGLENITSSRDIAFMEPAAPIQAIAPGIEAGAQIGKPIFDQRATWALGLFAPGAGAIEYGNASQNFGSLVSRLTWLPDSERIAVQRLNRVQDRLQLLLIHAASGTSRTLLEETDPFWINVHDALRFLPKSNQFLWASERTGFQHLYLYSMEGTLVKQLTGGEWTVTSVAGVNEAAGVVYYVSTEAGPLDRHLYSVGFAGGARRKLSAAEGTHTINMSPTAGFYQDSHSSAVQPPRRTIHDASGKQLSVFREADTKVQETYELLPSEIVKVQVDDGTTLYARVIKPAKFDPAKKYPAIVMVYGGPHTQTVTNSWSGASFNQALAHRGFVIWQLDNRGSYGRGHRFEARLYRRLGMQELEDQLMGLDHLIAQGYVDPARIGIHGWSYGGFMTLYSMLNAPRRFKAGIAGAPVTDWRNYDTIYTERYLGTPQMNNDGYQKSSPVNIAENLEGKLMLVHNFEDDNVLFQNTMQMNDALQRAGKSFELMLFPQKAHGVTGPSRRYMLERMAAFFEANLGR